MGRKVNIVCTGMLDTKGDEIQYLAKLIRDAGQNAIIMDLSLGHEAEWADIPLREVLAYVDKKPEEVFALSRTDAIEVVGEAGIQKILDMVNKKEVDGIISWAGGIGTTTVTMLMRALPLGFPKVMLSMQAPVDGSSFLGVSDIYMSNPISEKGINKLTRKTIGNGVAAVIGMAKRMAEYKESENDNPLAAITMYGTTTPSALRCGAFMEQNGWDVLYVPQGGLGATMEDLIRSGDITALFDLCTGEITNTYFHSVAALPKDWKGTRYTAAFDMGIPTVTAPGGMDQSAFGPLSACTPEMLEQFKTGERNTYRDTGIPYYHGQICLILPPTLKETVMFSEYMIEKFNKAKGPALFLMPMKGWSAYDQEEAHASKEMGWAEKLDAPNWIPDEDNPHWSRRATTAWKVFEEQWDRSNEDIDVIQTDLHILDPEFSQLACQAMADMLRGEWKPGMYRDNPCVVK